MSANATMKAKAYIQPRYRASVYTFWTSCEACPEWPWPSRDKRTEAYVIHTCHDSDYPNTPCRFFEYMEADNEDGVWIYCNNPKWES